MRAALAALLVVAVLAGGVLAWGYWRTVTHGTLHVLASTSADPQFGVFTIRHPTAGDCRREEREATRDTAGTYATIYIPSGKAVTVDLTKLKGKTINASWFDPRTGKSRAMDVPFKNGAAQEFKPPATDAEKDWVLVLE